MHGLATIINTNKQLAEANKIIEASKGKPDNLEKHLQEYLKERERRNALSISSK